MTAILHATRFARRSHHSSMELEQGEVSEDERDDRVATVVPITDKVRASFCSGFNLASHKPSLLFSNASLFSLLVAGEIPANAHKLFL